jgi:two-component system LytT family response regulator
MLQRVHATLEKEGASTMAEPLSEMLEARRRDSRTLDRIVVKRGDRILLVSVDDIDWIESAGNYVRLHVGKDSHLIRETMNAIEGKLPEGFIRIHRTTIVRLDRIKELERIAHGDYHVILKDGTIVLLSRHFRDKLEAVLGRF